MPMLKFATEGRGVTEQGAAPSHLNGCVTTRIYCLPGCPPGRRTRPENRVQFQSAVEARAAGFRPCKVCKPDGPTPAVETVFTMERATPLGRYLSLCTERGVVCLGPMSKGERHVARWREQGAEIVEGGDHNATVFQQLDEYFAGRRRAFDVPLDLRGGVFQQRVWDLLLAIPYGETRTYGALAAALGRPAASRAVGRANATNPVSIVVPCHRVVGASGALTGYAGGLDRKEALLRFEEEAARRAYRPIRWAARA